MEAAHDHPPLPPGVKVLQVRNPFGAHEVLWSSDFDFRCLPRLFSPCGKTPPSLGLPRLLELPTLSHMRLPPTSASWTTCPLPPPYSEGWVGGKSTSWGLVPSLAALLAYLPFHVFSWSDCLLCPVATEHAHEPGHSPLYLILPLPSLMVNSD